MSKLSVRVSVQGQQQQSVGAKAGAACVAPRKPEGAFGGDIAQKQPQFPALSRGTSGLVMADSYIAKQSPFIAAKPDSPKNTSAVHVMLITGVEHI